MADLAQVMDAIAQEKQQVTDAVTDFHNQIQALRDQIAQGTPVTTTDLDNIVTAVHDIFVPPAPPTPTV